MFEQDQPTQNEAPSTAQSLYRTWRSRDFSDVVGQAHVTQTLRNAVLMRQVGHAYLFTGPRGTGKTSTARILARAVNCLDPHNGEPCNKCASCQSMLENRCLDLVEIDAASNNSVDNVRDLREKVNFRPAEVSRKVYIIDEVHMLSTSAFNALLKTLEEPPAHVLFVLATTDVHKVPATITSRCQRLDFRAISLRDTAARMAYICGQEGISASEAALELIAQQATGSLRDALSLLEQVRAYEGTAIGVTEVEQALGLARRETLADLSAAIISGDIGAALTLIGDLAAAGADMRQYARQLVQYWRDLLLLSAGGVKTLGYTPDEQVTALAARLSERDITTVLKAFLQPDYSGRKSASAQWQLELAVAEASQHFAASDTRAPARDAAASAPARLAPTATRGTPERTPVAPARAEIAAMETPPWPDDDLPLAASCDAARDVAPAPEPQAHQMDRVLAAQANDLPAPPGGVAARAGGPDGPAEEPAPSATGAHAAGTRSRDHVPAAERDRDNGATDSSAAPAPTPGTPSDDVRQLWTQARRLLKRPVDAYLNGSCSPVGLEGDVFVLAFPPQSSFHKEQVEKSQNRSPIEGALARVVGRPVSLRCVTMSQQLSSPEDAGTPPRDTFLEEAARRLRGVHMDHTQP